MEALLRARSSAVRANHGGFEQSALRESNAPGLAVTFLRMIWSIVPEAHALVAIMAVVLVLLLAWSALRGRSGKRRFEARKPLGAISRVPPTPESAPAIATTPLVLLVNPRSGGGGGGVIAAAAAALSAAPPDVYLLTPGGIADALRRLSSLRASGMAPRLVVAGGDGTVTAVVHSLLSAGLGAVVPVAVLPLGTGNDVARSLGARAPRLADLDTWLNCVRNGDLSLADVFDVSFDVAPGGAIVCVRDGREVQLREEVVRGVAFAYVSVGLDARVVYDVELRRRRTAAGNRALYAASGAMHVLAAPCVSACASVLTRACCSFQSVDLVSDEASVDVETGRVDHRGVGVPLALQVEAPGCKCSCAGMTHAAAALTSCSQAVTSVASDFAPLPPVTDLVEFLELDGPDGAVIRACGSVAASKRDASAQGPEQALLREHRRAIRVQKSSELAAETVITRIGAIPAPPPPPPLPRLHCLVAQLCPSYGGGGNLWAAARGMAPGELSRAASIAAHAATSSNADAHGVEIGDIASDDGSEATGYEQGVGSETEANDSDFSNVRRDENMRPQVDTSWATATVASAAMARSQGTKRRVSPRARNFCCGSVATFLRYFLRNLRALGIDIRIMSTPPPPTRAGAVGGSSGTPSSAWRVNKTSSSMTTNSKASDAWAPQSAADGVFELVGVDSLVAEGAAVGLRACMPRGAAAPLGGLRRLAQASALRLSFMPRVTQHRRQLDPQVCGASFSGNERMMDNVDVISRDGVALQLWGPHPHHDKRADLQQLKHQHGAPLMAASTTAPMVTLQSVPVTAQAVSTVTSAAVEPTAPVRHAALHVGASEQSARARHGGLPPAPRGHSTATAAEMPLTTAVGIAGASWLRRATATAISRSHHEDVNTARGKLGTDYDVERASGSRSPQVLDGDRMHHSSSNTAVKGDVTGTTRLQRAKQFLRPHQRMVLLAPPDDAIMHNTPTPGTADDGYSVASGGIGATPLRLRSDRVESWSEAQQRPEGRQYALVPHGAIVPGFNRNLANEALVTHGAATQQRSNSCGVQHDVSSVRPESRYHEKDEGYVSSTPPTTPATAMRLDASLATAFDVSAAGGVRFRGGGNPTNFAVEADDQTADTGAIVVTSSSSWTAVPPTPLTPATGSHDKRVFAASESREGPRGNSSPKAPVKDEYVHMGGVWAGTQPTYVQVDGEAYKVFGLRSLELRWRARVRVVSMR